MHPGQCCDFVTILHCLLHFLLHGGDDDDLCTSPLSAGVSFFPALSTRLWPPSGATNVSTRSAFLTFCFPVLASASSCRCFMMAAAAASLHDGRYVLPPPRAACFSS